MLSRPRKPPSKTFRPVRSLRLTHQVKFSSSFWKQPLSHSRSPSPRCRRFEAVGEDGRPGVDRRVDVAEVPLVGRDLAVGVHVPLAQHQLELVLAEIGVDERQGEDVEGEVPGRVPGVFPLVGHRDDVAVVHVVPVVVARGGLPRRLERVGPALLQPLVDVVVVELLGPEHPRQGLPHHVGRVGVQRGRDDGGVELVRLGPPRPEDLVEAAAERPRAVAVALGRGRRGDVGEAQPDRPALAGADRQAVMGGRLGPGLLRVQPALLAVHDEVVDAVLDVRGPVRDAEDPLRVRLVLREEQGDVPLAGEVSHAELVVDGPDDAIRRDPGTSCSTGRSAVPCQDHRLRNQSVGRT